MSRAENHHAAYVIADQIQDEASRLAAGEPDLPRWNELHARALEELGPNHRVTWEVASFRALALALFGHEEMALASMDETIAAAEAVADAAADGPSDGALGDALSGAALEDPEDSEEGLRELVTRGVVLDLKGQKASMFAAVGRTDEAVKLYREVMNGHMTLHGGVTGTVIETQLRLAEALHEVERDQEALREVEVALKVTDQLLGPSHEDSLRLIELHGELLQDLGRDREAIRALRKQLARLALYVGRDAEETNDLRTRLVSHAVQEAELELARATWEALREETSRKLGEDHPQTRMILVREIVLLLREGHPEQARELMDAFLAGAEKTGDAEELAELGRAWVLGHRVLEREDPTPEAGQAVGAAIDEHLERMEERGDPADRNEAERLRVLWLFDAARVTEALDFVLDRALEPDRRTMMLLEAASWRLIDEDEPTLERAREHLLERTTRDQGFGVWDLLQRASMDPYHVRMDLPEDHEDHLSQEEGSGIIVAHLRRIQQAQQEVLREDHPERLMTRSFLGEELLDAGRPAEALEALEGLPEQSEAVFGTNHTLADDAREMLQRARVEGDLS